MANRKVMDAVNINTGEKVFFNAHAGATYMSDGRNVEDAIGDLKEDISERNIRAVEHINADEAPSYVTNAEFEQILQSINNALNKINGGTNE